MTIWERIFGNKPETKEIPYDPADDLDFQGAATEKPKDTYNPKHTGGWILDNHMTSRPFK